MVNGRVLKTFSLLAQESIEDHKPHTNYEFDSQPSAIEKCRLKYVENQWILFEILYSCDELEF